MEALLRVSNECGIVVVLLIYSDIGKIPLSYGHCNDVRWAAPGAGKLLPATTDRAAYPNAPTSCVIAVAISRTIPNNRRTGAKISSCSRAGGAAAVEGGFAVVAIGGRVTGGRKYLRKHVQRHVDVEAQDGRLQRQPRHPMARREAGDFRGQQFARMADAASPPMPSV
jgi:hypothetical protein